VLIPRKEQARHENILPYRYECDANAPWVSVGRSVCVRRSVLLAAGIEQLGRADGGLTPRRPAGAALRAARTSAALGRTAGKIGSCRKVAMEADLGSRASTERNDTAKLGEAVVEEDWLGRWAM